MSNSPQSGTPRVRNTSADNAHANRARPNRISARNFCLTFFGSGGEAGNIPPTTFITGEDCVRWNAIILDGNEAEHASKVSFFIVQTERSASGRMHYQGYVEFKKRVGKREVKRIFGERVSLRVAVGTGAQNIRYCTKLDTRITGEPYCIAGQWGQCKQKTSSLMRIAIKIQNKVSMEDLESEHPDMVMMHPGKIMGFMARCKGVRDEKPKIIILTGLTRSGKSQYAKHWKGAYWVGGPAAGSGIVWFGGYYGQSVCVFDEFHSGWFHLTELLKFMDSTPWKVAPKGSQVEFTSGTLVFTSNVDPRDWYSGYKGKKLHKDALEARIQEFAEIIDFKKEIVDWGPRGQQVIFRRTKRTETFKFRDDFGQNFAGMGTGFIPAGNGDSSGNGFPMMFMNNSN